MTPIRMDLASARLDRPLATWQMAQEPPEEQPVNAPRLYQPERTIPSLRTEYWRPGPPVPQDRRLPTWPAVQVPPLSNTSPDQRSTGATRAVSNGFAAINRQSSSSERPDSPVIDIPSAIEMPRPCRSRPPLWLLGENGLQQASGTQQAEKSPTVHKEPGAEAITVQPPFEMSLHLEDMVRKLRNEGGSPIRESYLVFEGDCIAEQQSEDCPKDSVQSTKSLAEELYDEHFEMLKDRRVDWAIWESCSKFRAKYDPIRFLGFYGTTFIPNPSKACNECGPKSMPPISAESRNDSAYAPNGLPSWGGSTAQGSEPSTNLATQSLFHQLDGINEYINEHRSPAGHYGLTQAQARQALERRPPSSIRPVSGPSALNWNFSSLPRDISDGLSIENYGTPGSPRPTSSISNHRAVSRVPRSFGGSPNVSPYPSLDSNASGPGPAPPNIERVLAYGPSNQISQRSPGRFYPSGSTRARGSRGRGRGRGQSQREALSPSYQVLNARVRRGNYNQHVWIPPRD